MRAAIAALGLAALSLPAMASDLGCKENPSLIASCYWIKGSVNVTADVGPALWPASGSRPIIIREGPGSDKDMPAELGDILLGDIVASVSGNFEVCPIPPPSPADEKFACIEAITQMTVVHGKAWKPPR